MYVYFSVPAALLYIVNAVILGETPVWALTSYIVVSFNAYYFCYISLKWTLDRYDEWTKKCTTPRVPVSGDQITLQEVLANKTSFDLFAKHCVMEHNVENLLFI